MTRIKVCASDLAQGGVLGKLRKLIKLYNLRKLRKFSPDAICGEFGGLMRPGTSAEEGRTHAPGFYHQALHRLVVQRIPLAKQGPGDASIAVASSVLMEDSGDASLFIGITVRSGDDPAPVVVHAAGYARCLEQPLEHMPWSQLGDQPRLFFSTDRFS